MAAGRSGPFQGRTPPGQKRRLPLQTSQWSGGCTSHGQQAPAGCVAAACISPQRVFGCRHGHMRGGSITMDHYAGVVFSVEGSSLRSGRSRSARWPGDSSAVPGDSLLEVSRVGEEAVGIGRASGGPRAGAGWLMPETLSLSGWHRRDEPYAPAGRDPGRAAAACMSQPRRAELQVDRCGESAQ